LAEAEEVGLEAPVDDSSDFWEAIENAWNESEAKEILLALGITLVACCGWSAGVGAAMLLGMGISSNLPPWLVIVAPIGSLAATRIFGAICLRSQKS